MKKLILVNLKMYFNSNEQIDSYIDKLKEEKENIIVFPSYIYLNKFVQNNFICGSQNISLHKNGSYTGEISASSIKDIGAKYTIIGHSEIRKYFKETGSIINQKIKNALENNLKVVLCIGENIKQNIMDQTLEVLNNQIKKALKDINDEIIISYEPVWAIGTGQTPTSEEIEKVSRYIKSLFKYDVKVLYGGSVSEENIETLNQIKNIDGFLIGKAGTIPSSLKKIIEVTQK